MPPKALERPHRLHSTLLSEAQYEQIELYAKVHDISVDEALKQLARTGLKHVKVKIRRNRESGRGMV